MIHDLIWNIHRARNTFRVLIQWKIRWYIHHTAVHNRTQPHTSIVKSKNPIRYVHRNLSGIFRTFIWPQMVNKSGLFCKYTQYVRIGYVYIWIHRHTKHSAYFNHQRISHIHITHTLRHCLRINGIFNSKIQHEDQSRMLCTTIIKTDLSGDL